MGNLYENITALCNERGIKPGKMCAEIGISRGLITDLKMGRKADITSATAQKIADYFGVTIGYLLGKENTSIAKDERMISDSDIKFALFGGRDDITDEMYEEVKRFAKFLAQRDSKEGSD